MADLVLLTETLQTKQTEGGDSDRDKLLLPDGDQG